MTRSNTTEHHELTILFKVSHIQREKSLYDLGFFYVLVSWKQHPSPTLSISTSNFSEFI